MQLRQRNQSPIPTVQAKRTLPSPCPKPPPQSKKLRMKKEWARSRGWTRRPSRPCRFLPSESANERRHRSAAPLYATSILLLSTSTNVPLSFGFHAVGTTTFAPRYDRYDGRRAAGALLAAVIAAPVTGLPQYDTSAPRFWRQISAFQHNCITTVCRRTNRAAGRRHVCRPFVGRLCGEPHWVYYF